eukprot:TRINITY_DN12375_c1_g1_i1.p1 TRINITY_DN12375_c1_g1~~TRINITY_DN12375_c1_g1_i1.p1  ORF type:complete len:1013 (+),score=134.69 TRINITY_DN12375_c1_g1_i1:33-3071(+)
MSSPWIIEQLESEDTSSPPKLPFSPEKMSFVRGVSDIIEIYSGGHNSAAVQTQGLIKKVELCETGTPYVTDAKQIRVPPGNGTCGHSEVDCLVLAWENQCDKAGIVITTLVDYSFRLETPFPPKQLAVLNDKVLVAGGPQICFLKLSLDDPVSLDAVPLREEVAPDTIICISVIESNVVTLHESGTVRCWANEGTDAEMLLGLQREVQLSTFSSQPFYNMVSSCCLNNHVWVTSSEKSLLISLSPWSTNAVSQSAPSAVHIAGDPTTGVDLLFGENSYAAAYCGAQTHTVDFSYVCESGLFPDFNSLIVVPLPLSFSKMGFRVYRNSGYTTYELTTSEYVSLRALSELSVLGSEKSVALKLLQETPDAPLSSLLSLLLEKRLSQHIVTWLSECQVESNNDLAVVKGILFWLDSLVKVFDHTIEECCTSLERGSWSQTHYEQAVSVSIKIPQCLAIIESLCAIESNAGTTSLKRLSLAMEAFQLQLKHLLWAANNLANGSLEYDLMKTSVLELENTRMSIVEDTVMETAINPLREITTHTASQMTEDQRTSTDIGSITNMLSSVKQSGGNAVPLGLMERMQQLHKKVEGEPRIALSFDIISKYATLTGGDGNDGPTDLFDEDTGCIRIRRLFVVPEPVLLPVGHKIDLITPVGAGWSSAVIISHNQDDTFDAKTSDEHVHRSIPYSNMVSRGSASVDPETQRLLQTSLFYLFLLKVDNQSTLASDYVSYLGGLPRGWVHFLRSLWAADFGTRFDLAKYPLHLPTDQSLANFFLGRIDPASLRVLSACASDCALNSAFLLWGRMETVSDYRGFVSMFDDLLKYGNKNLYPKKGSSALLFAHIQSLVGIGESGQAMEVVRKVKVPFGAALVLHYVLQTGSCPSQVMNFPVNESEELSIEHYIHRLRDIQRLNKAALKAPLASVDSSRLLVGFLHSRHRFHDVYATCLESNRLDFLPLTNNLEATLPPLQKLLAQKRQSASLCATRPLVSSAPIVDATEAPQHDSQLPTAGYTRKI